MACSGRTQVGRPSEEEAARVRRQEAREPFERGNGSGYRNSPTARPGIRQWQNGTTRCEFGRTCRRISATSGASTTYPVSDHDRLREYIGGLERPCLLRRHGNSTASAIPGRVSWRRSRSAKPDQAPGITRMSGHRRSDSSAVTRMSSCTTAVAAMKRSAGSS